MAKKLLKKDPDARAAIFVVSDGTGETATAAVRAALVQFRPSWHLHTYGDLRQPQQARVLIEEAARVGALVVFTLVDQEVLRALQEAAVERRVETVDLLSPLVLRIAQHLGSEPLHRVGFLHGYTDEYFARVNAVEFAVRHDDGANTHDLAEADIVLVGVSRTSKTPLSMYLAQRGFKTANVPIVPGATLPSELLTLRPEIVFGLMISPDTLMTIRETRERSIGAEPQLSLQSYSGYSDFSEIQKELDAARRLFRKHGWRVVHISGRAVEETASRVLHLLDSPYERPKT